MSYSTCSLEEVSPHSVWEEGEIRLQVSAVLDCGAKSLHIVCAQPINLHSVGAQLTICFLFFTVLSLTKKVFLLMYAT